MRSTLYNGKRKAGTHGNRGGIKILVILFHVFSILLQFIHGVEIKLGIFVLDRLESRYMLYGVSSLVRVLSILYLLKRTIGGRR